MAYEISHPGWLSFLISLQGRSSAEGYLTAAFHKGNLS